MSGPKTILIADDEETVRSLVKRLLGKTYKVLEADNGEEAVKVAVNQKPDLILMDILMPKMDGLTACYAIKRNQATKEIPVVMLTAVDYELNRKLSQDVMGAQDYITKPFNSEALMSMIAKCLNDKAS
ncbi:Alkaline phosphatase synthesis transcriptional regulatory protein PhoP [subsurface metagenome]